MRIAIDAHMVGERETGNETYTLSLIRALLALPAETRGDAEFLLYTTHPERLLPRLEGSIPASIKHIRPAFAPLRLLFGMPLNAVRDRADLLHVSYVAPPVRPSPCVVTVHDISYEFFPQFFSPRDRVMLRTMVPFTLRRAARIIAVSERGRSEIISRYGVSAERVAVTYEATAEQFCPIADPVALADVRRRYGLQARYLLAVGNLQPRKNLIRLVDAFARLRGQGQLSDVQLVLAGKAQWRESDLFARVQQSGLADQVRFPGYIEEADLPTLYSGALAFVYPSLYEGFGLPPLEAMACGTPVVCSNAASLPEVVGDAALTCDPHDTESLAAALAQVIAQPALRGELRTRGLRRVARFSWRRCAEETLAVYRAAVKNQHRQWFPMSC